MFLTAVGVDVDTQIARSVRGILAANGNQYQRRYRAHPEICGENKPLCQPYPFGVLKGTDRVLVSGSLRPSSTYCIRVGTGTAVLIFNNAASKGDLPPAPGC